MITLLVACGEGSGPSVAWSREPVVGDDATSKDKHGQNDFFLLHDTHASALLHIYNIPCDGEPSRHRTEHLLV